MADKTPISQLPAGAMTGANVDVDADYLAIDDVSAGNTKKITPKELVANTKSFVQSGSAKSRTAQDKMRDIVSILDWVEGDGSDESTDAQEAIDAVSLAGGGDLWVPGGVDVTCNVTLADGVVIRGPRMTHTPWTTTGGRFIAAAAGAVIDTPVATTKDCGVVGLGIQGLGAGTACKGIHFRDVDRGQVKSVTFNNISDEALLEDSTCAACVYEDLFAQNCLLDRSQAAKIGVFDWAGTDHVVSRVEATASLSALSDANAYLCGIVIRGANGVYTGLIGEISDEGIHLTSAASLNRISDSRADLNFGHGWNIIGTSNQLSNCLSLNNSQETTNTYDGFIAASGSGLNQLSNCRSASTVATVHRYGFNDAVSSATAKNSYINPQSAGHGTAAFLNSNTAGSSFSFPAGGEKTLTANSATPDVTGYERFITANTNPTTITNFTGGVSGQQITVVCNDANTTIQHNGSTITLAGLGSKDLRQRSLYQFVKTGGLWREVDNLDGGCTADVGDAAKTLQARVDDVFQIWATELTADRAVTLSATGAYAGAAFTILRPAAGAFNLNVGTGPLYALAVGEACKVLYTGAAWTGVQKWTI